MGFMPTALPLAFGRNGNGNALCSASILDAAPGSRAFVGMALQQTADPTIDLDDSRDAVLPSPASAQGQTAHLLRSPANARRLLDAISPLEQGGGSVRQLAEQVGWNKRSGSTSDALGDCRNETYRMAPDSRSPSRSANPRIVVCRQSPLKTRPCRPSSTATLSKDTNRAFSKANASARHRPCCARSSASSAPPSDSVRERVLAADSDTLLQWLDRILVAESVDAVFH